MAAIMTRGGFLKRQQARRAAAAAALVGVTLAVLGLPRGPQFSAGPSSTGGHGSLTAAPLQQQLPHLALASASGPAPQAASSTGEEAAAPKPRPAPAPAGATRGVLPLTAAAAVVLIWKSRSLTALKAGEAAAAPPAKAKAPRISAFDSLRFFLIFYIVCGHFISFAKPSPLVFKLVTQINVVVGAFFGLSGYVAAYTGCEIGEKKAKDNVVSTPVPKYILAKIFGYWPLHLVVILMFSPMFIFADNLYNGPLITAFHGLIATTMTQAWFPLHAEVWNAPTWFLGALTFATVLQPYFLPILARQGKKELRRSCFWLTLFTLLPRVAYCYDTSAWGLLEGAMSPKAFANLAFFNFMRFSPFFAVMEVMLGFVACRLVMLDGAEEGETAPKVGAMDTLLPLAGMLAVIVLRGTGVLALSDMLVRSCIFMPLFLNFLMGLHRASIVPKVTDPIAKILALKPLTWLGGLSFPIFVVHGPLGQLFYKKAIAARLFGGPMNVVYGPWFFWVYLLIVGILAWFLQNFFMTSPKVGTWSKNVQAKLVKYL